MTLYFYAMLLAVCCDSTCSYSRLVPLKQWLMIHVLFLFSLQFREADSAERAMANLNGLELAGRAMKINHVTPESQGGGMVPGQWRHWTRRILREEGLG